MIKRCLPLLMILMLLLNTSTASALAKPLPAPLFITVGSGAYPPYGDVYSWRNPGLNRKTSGGYASYPMVSSNGQWLAYLSVPRFFVHQPDAIVEQHTAPQDIFLMNIATNNTIQIASQSPKASFKEGAMAYTLRSTPSWSPDGNSLVWTEITTDQVAGTNIDFKTEQLVVYDIKLKKTRVIVNELPSHILLRTNPELSTVAWGVGGIAVSIIQPGVKSLVVHIYDANGTLLCQSGDVTAPAFMISQLIWIKAGDKDYVSSVSGGAMIDSLTGEIVDMPGVPEMYNPAVPDGYRISYGEAAPDEANTNWLVTLNGQVVQVLDAVRIATMWDMTISPDGKQVAYIGFIAQGQGQTGAAFYFNGKKDATPINTPGAGEQLAWSAPAWRILYPPSIFF